MQRSIWLAAALALVLATAIAEARTWTDKSGAYKVEAELVEVVDGKAKLKKTDGTVISVSVDVLSPADQAFLKQHAAAKPAAQPNAPAAPAPAAQPASKPADGPQLPMPSEAECRQFGKVIEESVRNGNTDVLKDAIDWNGLMARGSKGLDLPAKLRDDFLEGLKSKIGTANGLLGVIAAKVANGGSYRMLGIQQRDGEHQVLFRLLMETEDCNYHAWTLTKTAAGKVLAVDIASFATGDQFSDNIRCGLVHVIAINSSSLVDRVFGKQAQARKSMEALAGMSRLLREERGADAMAIYNELPESLKKDRQFMLLRVFAAQKISPEEYLAALDELRQAYPNSESLNLLLIDYHTYKGEWAKVREAVDRLVKVIGKDAHLEYLRAMTYANEQNVKKTREGLKRALAIESDHAPALQSLKELDEAQAGQQPAAPQ